MSYTEALSYYLGAFVDELARLHVRDVVISPGSRSTPLAMLMAEHTDIQTYLHVDERSAAFFALGIAKAKKRPVAILCTSGTAAANYFPAVSEAFHSRIPLLVITADRPHELRNVGAPQAMDQLHMFGSFVKEFIEMALPEASEHMYRYVRKTAARAVSTALGAPKGPVHMNFPVREPLIPDFSLPNLWGAGRSNQQTEVHMGVATPSSSYIQSLTERLSSFEKGLIVCGDQDDAALASAVVALSEALQYPILADPLSQLRSGVHAKQNIVDCYDTFLRNETFCEEWKPDVVIRFGAMPISKALTQYMQKQTNALHIVVDEGEGWRDPLLVASEMVYANEVSFCKELAKQMPYKAETNWLNAWRDVNAFTKQQLTDINHFEEVFEGRVITEIAQLCPTDTTLFVGNSMPIRDTDTFFFTNDKRMSVIANRGVNGIDGIISTALGVSVAHSPLVLVLGDLSFYHDLNGLLAAKLHKLNATIVIVNNDGGGIFSFLPQYGEKQHFEALFGTPLGLDYEHVVRMYDGQFYRTETWDDFQTAIRNGVSNDGLQVVEIRTNREANLQMHRSLWASISEALTNKLLEEKA
ncbi:2-succinyl-5-enolpyruvyl-6-hydroxy-3-cyclohexene-1-carboxylic-acid synthase [Microbacteriaceae bacterium 4G12]